LSATHRNVNCRIISIGSTSAIYQQRLDAVIKFESEPKLEADSQAHYDPCREVAEQARLMDDPSLVTA
jgi:hypothetical protein